MSCPSEEGVTEARQVSAFFLTVTKLMSSKQALVEGKRYPKNVVEVFNFIDCW